MTELGPGTTCTLMPAATAAATKRAPGSLMPGIPASVTSATVSPALSRSTIFCMRDSGVFASTHSRGLPLMPK